MIAAIYDCKSTEQRVTDDQNSVASHALEALASREAA
jgi:hypothetical protein